MLKSNTKNQKEEESKTKIKNGVRIQLKCDSVKALFQLTPMCSNSQNLRDFSVAPNAGLLTRKNIVEE
jgi:hypothetical protein